MKFSTKYKIQEEYYEWARKKNEKLKDSAELKECPINFLSFLSEKYYIIPKNLTGTNNGRD